MTGKRFGSYNFAGPILLLIHAIYRIHPYNRRHRYLSLEKVHTFPISWRINLSYFSHLGFSPL